MTTVEAPKPEGRPAFLALFFNKNFDFSYHLLFTSDEFWAMADAKIQNLQWAKLIFVDNGDVHEDITPEEAQDRRQEANS